jgi:sulfur-carrier protein
MPVRILYFAWVKEAVGRDEEVCALPENIRTLGEVAHWLAERYPIFTDLSRVRGAIDQVMAKMDAPIAGVKEIAFFPPVTGG